MFEVIDGGPQTTVQDLGRPGYLHTGMPPSGAFDSFSLRVANLLVGNNPGGRYLVGRDPGDAGLEILLLGCKLRATADHVIAVTGGDLSPTRNGEPLPMWQSVRVGAGDVIAFPMPRLGVRAYLAITGGIDVPMFLGSRATNVRAAAGGIDGRGLKTGDQLCIGKPTRTLSQLAGRSWPAAARPAHAVPWTVRVVLGPQDHLFEPESVETFLTTDWKLSPISDRMGCRYIGPKLEFLPRPDYLIEQAGSDPSNIVDDGTPLGGIQVPSGLEPIVMGADVPSFGGYAKIATVISSDIGIVGQGKPGDIVQFRAVDVAEAEEIGLAQEALIAESTVVQA
ncbi:MAG: biotin-dependent carboxyltransferase family protein [Thermomicrobiales bacterium]